MKPAPPAVAAGGRALAADIRQMIEGARHQVAQAVNAGLTGLYWQIGTRIRQDILKERRAEYGAEIVATLSRQLVPDFGRGFDALQADGRLTPDLVFQDPYLLDFLGLKDTYSEKDLESALLRDIERFLLELGAGFAFVERQKRITLDRYGVPRQPVGKPPLGPPSTAMPLTRLPPASRFPALTTNSQPPLSRSPVPPLALSRS